MGIIGGPPIGGAGNIPGLGGPPEQKRQSVKPPHSKFLSHSQTNLAPH